MNDPAGTPTAIIHLQRGIGRNGNFPPRRRSYRRIGQQLNSPGEKSHSPVWALRSAATPNTPEESMMLTRRKAAGICTLNGPVRSRTRVPAWPTPGSNPPHLFAFCRPAVQFVMIVRGAIRSFAVRVVTRKRFPSRLTS
jgi:hypothetical protein